MLIEILEGFVVWILVNQFVIISGYMSIFIQILNIKTSVMKQIIKLKRAYESAESDDGFRVYVDRLWPRGLSHETFHYDLWDKDIAPSTELREWFHSDAEDNWPKFEKAYKSELLSNPAFASLEETLSGKPVVTLLYSSRDEEHNNAEVLREMLISRMATHFH